METKLLSSGSEKCIHCVMNFSRGQFPGQTWLIPINGVRWAVIVTSVNPKVCCVWMTRQGCANSRAAACPVWGWCQGRLPAW